MDTHRRRRRKRRYSCLQNAPSSFLEGSTRRPRPLSFLAFRAAAAFGVNDATASRLAGIAATRAFFITLQVNRAIRLHIAASQVRERARRVGRRERRKVKTLAVPRFTCPTFCMLPASHSLSPSALVHRRDGADRIQRLRVILGQCWLPESSGWPWPAKRPSHAT